MLDVFWEWVAEWGVLAVALFFFVLPFFVLRYRCPKCHRFFALEFRTKYLSGETRWTLYVCKYCGHEEERERIFGGNGGGNGG